MPIAGSARSLGWTLVISFATAVLITVAGLWYTNYVDEQAKDRTNAAIKESNRKWCSIVLLFNNTYKSQPPTTPAGKRLAEYMNTLAIDFECQEEVNK